MARPFLPRHRLVLLTSCRPSLCACTGEQEELVSEGDSVNELFIVVSGQLTSYRVSSLFNQEVRCGGWEGTSRPTQHAEHAGGCP